MKKKKNENTAEPWRICGLDSYFELFFRHLLSMKSGFLFPRNTFNWTFKTCIHTHTRKRRELRTDAGCFWHDVCTFLARFIFFVSKKFIRLNGYGRGKSEIHFHTIFAHTKVQPDITTHSSSSFQTILKSTKKTTHQQWIWILNNDEAHSKMRHCSDSHLLVAPLELLIVRVLTIWQTILNH